jgi:hypothetical protein
MDDGLGGAPTDRLDLVKQRTIRDLRSKGSGVMRSTRRGLRLAVVAFSLGAAVLFGGVATASADSVWNGATGAAVLTAH